MSTIEVVLDEMYLDWEYGYTDGTLVVEIKPLTEYDSVTVHNVLGRLETRPFKNVAGYEIVGATYFRCDQDGGEHEHSSYKGDEVTTTFPDAIDLIDDWCDNNQEILLEY